VEPDLQGRDDLSQQEVKRSEAGQPGRVGVPSGRALALVAERSNGGEVVTSIVRLARSVIESSEVARDRKV
jgi:hypothetical protein